MSRSGLVLVLGVVVVQGAMGQAPMPPVGSPQPVPGTPTNRIPTPGAGTPTGAVPGGVPVAPPAAPPTPVDAALMAHLQGWEAAMKGASNFYTECTLTRKNLLLKKSSEFTGSIMCMKPNLARMRLDAKPQAGQKADPNDYTAYISTGQAVYEYDGNAKQVTEYKLRAGGASDNLLLEFMSGSLTAAQIAQRFDIKRLKEEDKFYVYLEIRPREPRDKAEFESMILVLFQPSVPELGYLPRTVIIRKANGQDEETWDFPRPRTNVKEITATAFQYVPPPKDWKIQQTPTSGAPQPPMQPRVARPTNP